MARARTWCNIFRVILLSSTLIVAIYGLDKVNKISLTLEQLQLRNVVFEGNLTMIDEEGNEMYKIYRDRGDIVFEVNGTIVKKFGFK